MCPITLIRQETCRLANMVGSFFLGGEGHGALK